MMEQLSTLAKTDKETVSALQRIIVGIEERGLEKVPYDWLKPISGQGACNCELKPTRNRGIKPERILGLRTVLDRKEIVILCCMYRHAGKSLKIPGHVLEHANELASKAQGWIDERRSNG